MRTRRTQTLDGLWIPGAVRAAKILKTGVGVRRLDFERPEMNLSDLSLRIANTIELLRATQSPMRGADRVGHGI
jgi:hypothetical protein